MTCLAPFMAPLSTTDDPPLYDWAVTTPGESIPAACGITHAPHDALHAAMHALTHCAPGSRADIWTAELELLAGRGYRRAPWPRWTIELTADRTLSWTR